MEITKINERLRFSWGHIFAFLAIIVVGYTSFVGFTYLSQGNFIFGAIGMGVTVLVYIFVFITAQQLKASDVKMKKKILWERILVFGSPLVFAAGMVAMSHFWTVQSQNDEVVANFTSAINHGKGIFSDYEAYADERLAKYENSLNKIIAEKDTRPEIYHKAGFTPGVEEMQMDNMLEVLRLQLYNSNYDSLKNLAISWIENANSGASAYNVFLLGNTREISQAFTNWQHDLKGFTTKKLSNEEILYNVSDFESHSGSDAAKEITALGESFTNQKIPTLNAIIFAIIVYFMMIFPYLIQDRHSKSTLSLFGKKKEAVRMRETDETPRGFDEIETSAAEQKKAAQHKHEDKYKEDKDYPMF